MLLNPTQPPKTKRSEFTFGFHAASLAEIAQDNAVTLLTEAEMEGAFRELDFCVMGSRRSLNDKFELLRQGIAYGLTFKIVEETTSGLPYPLFAVYKRNKLNGEVRLASALSLGAGGHIELVDQAQYYDVVDEENVDPNAERAIEYTGEIDSGSMIDQSYFREYSEEVELFHEVTRSQEIMVTLPYRLGFVMDSRPERGYVGNTHVGFIYGAQVPVDADFDMKEELNDRVGWYSPAQLVAHVNGTAPIADVQFEPWSLLLIERITEISMKLMDVPRIEVTDATFDKLTEVLEK